MDKQKTVVIALGGNAITREFEEGNIDEQFANTSRALSGVVQLIQNGYHVALTHGNGPQVGNYLIRVEESRRLVPSLPLNIIVADLEGGMGYMIQQTLQNKLRLKRANPSVITVVTQVLVDQKDPSIYRPTKFVGPVFPKEQVAMLQEKRGWKMREDVGRGWRRVVASPVPTDVIERDTIRSLVEQGVVVIACGGGGIPVYQKENGEFAGIDGVIDKDLASAVLAKAIQADALYILTAVEKVALNYAMPNQVDLSEISVSQAEAWFEEGQFPAGSMGPKIRAAIDFIKAGGKECIIAKTEKLIEAIRGETGTRIVA